MAPPNVGRLPHPQSSGTHNDADQDEDSWQVRASTEDRAPSGMGTTWPPRSYTCSFCRTEFRSAQALGGHMNVHRHDRARLHQTKKSPMTISNPNTIPNPSTIYPSSSSTSGGSTLLIPTHQEFLVNGGLCLLYQLHDNDSNDPLIDPNSTLRLSVSPYPAADINSSFTAAFPQATYPSSVTLIHHISSKSKPSSLLNRYYNKNSITNERHNSHHDTGELDLELRLGHGPATLS